MAVDEESVAVLEVLLRLFLEQLALHDAVGNMEALEHRLHVVEVEVTVLGLVTGRLALRGENDDVLGVALLDGALELVVARLALRAAAAAARRRFLARGDAARALLLPPPVPVRGIAQVLARQVLERALDPAAQLGVALLLALETGDEGVERLDRAGRGQLIGGHELELVLALLEHLAERHRDVGRAVVLEPEEEIPRDRDLARLVVDDRLAQLLERPSVLKARGRSDDLPVDRPLGPPHRLKKDREGFARVALEQLVARRLHALLVAGAERVLESLVGVLGIGRENDARDDAPGEEESTHETCGDFHESLLRVRLRPSSPGSGSLSSRHILATA